MQLSKHRMTPLSAPAGASAFTPIFPACPAQPPVSPPAANPFPRPPAAAAPQGALDGGLDIPYGEKRFIGYDRKKKKVDTEIMRKYIYGGHVSEYMEELQEVRRTAHVEHFRTERAQVLLQWLLPHIQLVAVWPSSPFCRRRIRPVDLAAMRQRPTLPCPPPMPPHYL